MHFSGFCLYTIQLQIMTGINYKALVTEEATSGYKTTVKTLNTANLPQGEVLVSVQYSSVNYKDALSATGNKGVTRSYPHTPGIDAAGVVEQSTSSLFTTGDKVIVTGFDLGMNTSGGYGQFINVPAAWVVPLPETLSLKEAMIIGTAGFTAGISVSKLSEQVKPTDGKVVVTGATGGVGSMAVAMLSKSGYEVTAVSGKVQEYEFLRKLGASEIISGTDFLNVENKPVLPGTFAGAIDTVGGTYLERIIRSIKPLGAVTTCGSVSSTQLNLTVFPFILRGISLIGISAQNYPAALRPELWQKLGSDLKTEHLNEMFTEISLEETPEILLKILDGKLKGRTVVNLEK